MDPPRGVWVVGRQGKAGLRLRVVLAEFRSPGFRV